MALDEWLQAQRRKISAKSRLGEKLAYIHNHWDGLQTFLADGRIEIDSNRVETLMRPIALNRKNALFAPSRAFGSAKTLPGQGAMTKVALLGDASSR